MAEISTISINTQPAQVSIADLERELQETNEQLKQVDVNSQAFIDLQKKAAKAKGQIDQINKTTDTLSKGFQGFGENLAKVTGGISGGIAAATAAMQLMGVENENVIAGIAKLQQLMAFTQGISSLKGLAEGFSGLKGILKTVTGSLNGVKGALIGTGIGAFVVLLGTLIANWDKINEKIKEFTGGLDLATIATASFQAGWVAIKQTFIALLDTIKQFGQNFVIIVKGLGKAVVNYIKTPAEVVFKTIEAFFSTKGGLKDKAKAALGEAKKVVSDNFNEVKDSFADLSLDTTAWKKIGENAGDAFQAGITKANEKNKSKNIKEVEKQAKTEAEIRKEAEEKLNIELAKLHRSNAEDKLQQEIDIEKRRLALMEKDTLEYENQLNKIYDLEQKLKEKSTTDNTEEDPVIQQLKDSAQAYRDSLILEEEKLAQEKALNQKYYDEGKISYADYQANLTDIQNRESELRIKKQQDEENEKANLIANTMAVIRSASQLTTDILGSVIDQQDQTNKEGFEKAKKLQIAQATISMLTGIATALAGTFTTHSGVWDIALAAIQAASIAASGIANIAKIKATKFDSASTPSVSSNVSSTTITPPTQYTQAVQNANLESKLTDTKVYVLESDIRKTTNKVSVQESENTY